MDNQELKDDVQKHGISGKIEGHSQEVQQPLRRELDSLDDFEHLGHDSSPLKETEKDKGPQVHDLLGLNATESFTRDLINNTAENAATKIADIFDPIKQETERLSAKMDTNLLEMGDSFPDRKEADAKLDKFLSEISAASVPNKQSEDIAHKEKDSLFGDFKAASQNFMESEREVFKLPKLPPTSEPEIKPAAQIFETKPHRHPSDDLLEKYSDSDSDQEPLKKEGKPQPIAADVPRPNDIFENVKEPPIMICPMKPAAVKESEPVRVAEKSKPSAPAVEQAKQPEIIKKDAISEPKPSKIQTKPIEAEVMFCNIGLDTWFHPERLNPKVESLIYWRDPKKSGPVFAGVLIVLLALTYFSLISVVAYASLVALTGTISFRVYKTIVQAVQKTGDGHPFKEYLESDVALPQEKVKEVSEVAVAHINAGVSELRRLFLVEDLVDSIKFGVLLWCLTYLGSWFNGMTLIIIAWVALFTLPKVYEVNKTQIDKNLEIVRTKLAEITSKVKAAIPIGKKPEEKKEQ